MGREDFKDDVEDAEAGRVGEQVGPLNDADEEGGEEEPSEVVGELGADVGLLVWAITHWLVIVFAEGKGSKGERFVCE